MKFDDLAWAAFCYFYATKGDYKYVTLFKDRSLISTLRQNPSLVSFDDFKNKVITDFLNSWGRMFIMETTGREILSAITELPGYLAPFEEMSLLTSDLSDSKAVNSIKHIYDRLSGIDYIDMTGASKIAHILNDSLFVMLDRGIRLHFKVEKSADGYVTWLKTMQQRAIEVAADFCLKGLPGSPEQFLSDKLGYTAQGCTKSLAKFLDEFYWLTTGKDLPVPPRWWPGLREVVDSG
jgi:hypothetical protein